MISYETKQILHTVFQLNWLFNCTPYVWNYDKKTKDKQFLTKRSKMWMVYLNNGLIGCFILFSIFRFPKTLANKDDDGGTLFVMIHFAVICIALMLACLTFENHAKTEDIIEFMNSSFVTLDEFAASCIKTSILKRGIPKNGFEGFMKLFLIGILGLAVLGALLAFIEPGASFFFTSSFARNRNQFSDVVKWHSATVQLLFFLIHGYIFMSMSLIVTTWLFMLVPTGFSSLLIYREAKNGYNSKVTRNKFRTPVSILKWHSRGIIMNKVLNDIVSRNLTPNHIAIAIATAVCSNYCVVRIQLNEGIIFIMARTFMFILSLVDIGYIILAFTMVGRLVARSKGSLRSWQKAPLSRYFKKAFRATRPVWISFGDFYKAGSGTTFTLIMTIIKYTGKALIAFK